MRSQSRRFVKTSTAAFVVVLVAGILGSAGATTAAARDGGIRLSVNGKPGGYLSLTALRGAVDVPRTPSTLRTVADLIAGRPGGEYQRGGVSARALAIAAGVDPGHVSKMSVHRPGPGTVDLTRNEILNGFDGDPSGAVLEATFDPEYGEEVHFFRPLRDDLDANDPDAVDAARGEDLIVAIELDGGLLQVTAECDPCKADPESAVRLQAAVTAGLDGSPLAYYWQFGDGEYASGPEVTHGFPAGNWNVNVVVVSRDGASGAGSVNVVAGDPPKESQPGDSSGAGGSGSGPGGGGGSTNAPVHGPNKSNGDGNSARRTTPSKAKGSNSPATPSASTATPSATTATRSSEARRRRKVAAAQGSLVRVSGILISGPGEAVAIPKRLRSGGGMTAARRASIGGGPSWWLLGVIAGAAIFAAGGAGESRHRLSSLRNDGVG